MENNRHSSLFLLAVKRLMNGGALYGNSYSSYHAESTVESMDVDMEDMSDYITQVVNEINEKGPVTGSYRAQMIDLLNIQKDVVDEVGVVMDDFLKMNFETFYDNKNGKFLLYSVLVHPNNRFTQCHCEIIDIGFNIILGDVIVILTKVKKSWVSNSKTVEIVRIPPAINVNDVVNSMMIAVSTLFSQNVASQIGSDSLKRIEETAREMPNSEPNDNHRRKVYDPIRKMNVIVTDPTILKLLPTKWECFATNDIRKGLKRIKAPSYLFEN